GVRVFDATSGRETGRDADCRNRSFSAHFSPDSRRLVTTCFDGQVRLYAVEDGHLRKLLDVKPTGGKEPFAARFSPDGHAIAVGFYDTTTVQVLDAATLAETAWPSTQGVDEYDLENVAWSADGRYLVAGGRWRSNGRHPLRFWPVGEWLSYRDVPVSNES